MAAGWVASLAALTFIVLVCCAVYRFRASIRAFFCGRPKHTHRGPTVPNLPRTGPPPVQWQTTQPMMVGAATSVRPMQSVVGTIVPCNSNTAPNPSQVAIDPPPYWSSAGRALKEVDRAVRQEVKASTLAAVQKMMDGTWREIRTRDRRDKGEAAVLHKFRVAQVLRIENARLWNRHQRCRRQILNACQQSPLFEELGKPPREPFKTMALGAHDKDVAEMLRKMELKLEANEALLFHGTRPTAAYDICENGFKVNLAGTACGTLYGPGVYLAEASSKSDEYAQDDQDGLYMGLYAMLLCRVTCGVLNICPEKTPDVPKLVNSCTRDRTHHCVLGDREAARGTYREFVVYNADQIYPEFIVIYVRYAEEQMATE